MEVTILRTSEDNNIQVYTHDLKSFTIVDNAAPMPNEVVIDAATSNVKAPLMLMSTLNALQVIETLMLAAYKTKDSPTMEGASRIEEVNITLEG